MASSSFWLFDSSPMSSSQWQQQQQQQRRHQPQRRTFQRRSRRRLKPQVYMALGLFVFVLYHYHEWQTFDLQQQPQLSYGSMSLIQNAYQQQGLPPAVPTTSQQVVMKNAKGQVISRNSTTFSHFMAKKKILSSPNDKDNIVNPTTATTISMSEAQQGREFILDILKQVGIVDMTPQEVMQLPTLEQVQELYYSSKAKTSKSTAPLLDPPVLIGIEKACQEFQQNVPLSKRFLGIAGMFNSGTTALGLSLQANCRFPDREDQDFSNHVLTDKHGMLSQVPWAKHKMATLRNNHTIHKGIPKDHVLPIVLVRDPYYWMQSMCKQGYGARWDHIPGKHCPNLVPNEFDRKRFKKSLQKDAKSVPVWMGAGPGIGPTWDSLVHYWNDWYHSYLNADFPRIIVRFEDALFQNQQVVQSICKCGGGTMTAGAFQYVVDEAKSDHKQEQNNMISAMIQYGTNATRFKNMTREDLEFAKHHLDAHLMELFQYQPWEQ